MRTMMAALFCTVTMAASAHAAIREEPVTYQDGSTTMKGFVVYDDAIAGKRPGIVMVPEWWGITSHIRSEAQKFAQQGYTAFVADMYGDARMADNPKDAGAIASLRSFAKDRADRPSRPPGHSDKAIATRFGKGHNCCWRRLEPAPQGDVRSVFL